MRTTARESRCHRCGHTERKQREAERREREKRCISSCARSIIAPRTCSASCTRSLVRPPPKIPKISSSASANASRRLSASQDLLVRNEWDGVEIEDVVRCAARSLRRPHWFSYRRAAPQAALEGGFRKPSGSCSQARHQRGEISGALDGHRSCRCLRGNRGDTFT